MKNALAIGGAGLGAVLLLYMVSKSGATQTEGISYAAPDPNAVAAAETGVANEITANNTLAVDRAKVASDTILGLAGAQGGLYAAQINGGYALSTARVNAQAEEETTQISSAAAVQQAQYSAQANTAAAQAAAAAAMEINDKNAATQQAISDNQTTQARINKGSSTGNFLNTLIGGASGILSSLGSLGLKL